jgi:Fe-S cluster biosynthesis and repair protein YggX
LIRRRGRATSVSASSRACLILNEYRLMPWQKEAQELIAKQMEDFFFGEGAALPPGYVPQQAK